MPFGLTNAPATFQRLLKSCMGDLHLSTCLLYLDDIIIFSETYEQHLERLEAVFNRLRVKGLKLSPSKCVRFQRSINISDMLFPLKEWEPTLTRSAPWRTGPYPLQLKSFKSTRFRWILPKVHSSVFSGSSPASWRAPWDRSSDIAERSTPQGSFFAMGPRSAEVFRRAD